MWLKNGSKLVLLLILVAVSYALGWAWHDLFQRAAHQREISAGYELRLKLLSLANSHDEIANKMAAFKNQQVTTYWELREHNKRIEEASTLPLGIPATR